MQIRRLVAVTAVPLLLASVGCEKDKEAAKKNAGQSCEGLLKSADAAAALPSDLAAPSGATFYQVETQGKTKQYFAYVQGTDLVKARDDAAAALTSGGAQVKGKDQEEGAEAEAEFEKGSNEGSVQTIPYCQGYVRLRYRYGPK
jgi:hypothetical protein